MNRILEINSVNYGSTGTIMRNIAQTAEAEGFEVFTSCEKGKSTKNESYHRHIYIGNRLDRNIHLRLGKITGMYGTYSKHITAEFLRKIDQIKPDIIHIHNLHKGYINFEMLFSYIKEKKTPVVWTLHDCWSFTGQCPHFVYVGCDKWKIECGECPQYREYPSYLDKTKVMLERKKRAFGNVENLTIVTPSEWLANHVNESFLQQYPIKVIRNGIDLNEFRRIESNTITKKYHIDEGKVILGVSSIWNKKKGLDYFLELSKHIDDNTRIILVGVSKNVKEHLPPRITGIERTNSKTELAQLYSLADVFFNPTLEDTFPTVNLEALACGTPVLTFPTGGSPECIDPGCGKIVTPQNYVEELKKWVTDSKIRNSCILQAKEYDAKKCFVAYCNLYRDILN